MNTHKQAHHTEPCCSPEGCCIVPAPPYEFQRREFLKLAGMTSLALLASRAGVFAGPFVKEDFLRVIPTDKKLAAAWLESLTARGEPETFTGADLRYIGMPVGGLFCGTVYLGGDGRLWLWDIFNQCQLGCEPAGAMFNGTPLNPIFGSSFVAPLESEKYHRLEQGFEISVKSGGKEIKRTLDSRPGSGFQDVSFTGEYPIGVIRYSDPAVPVKVKLEAFSPFIPLDVKDSSLPATIFSFEITNTGSDKAEVAIEGLLENAVFQNHRFLDGVRRVSTQDGKGATIVFLSAEALAPSEVAQPDIVFEDWSNDTFAASGWGVEGEAFGVGPVLRSEFPVYMGDVGGDTQRVANSHAGGASADLNARDNATGKLVSKKFRIERKFIRTMLGGGAEPENLGVRLVIDGKIVRTATGANANPLALTNFDVSDLQGKEAHIEIVDNKAGSWGNTGVGSITFTDRPPLTDEEFARLPDAGSMAIALLGGPAEIRLKDAEVPLGQKLVGRVGRQLSIEPGKSETVNFLVSWHFPHAPKNILGGREHHYAARFPDAAGTAQFVAENFDRLASQTRLWRDTWYDSTLPYWFLNRTFANTTTLATTTCYLFDDGRFWAMEGVGCCAGTCIHVWHYAQAMARLFPEVERNHREFVDFGLAMKPDGTIAYRGESGDWYAVDGQAGRVVGAYREYQMSKDDAFLRRVWPGVKRALEKIIETDGDADGIIRGPLHNTLDADWNGVVPWLCGMYHVALKAGETMAVEVGDMAFAGKCRDILKVAAKNLDDLCWNEDYGYYIHIGDPARKTEVGAYEGCHIDQVLGQSWAWQVGLGDVMTRKHAKTALESLWKYNFTPDVGPFRSTRPAGRWYALPGEGGMIMLSNPFAPDIVFTGPSAGTSMYFNECMSGFEHQVASHMLWERMVTEGLATTRVIHDRYSAKFRNPYNEIECSDHYARAMASYGTFLASTGFEYNGPKRFIGFAPRLTPENFRAAFTSSEGWGTFEQKLDGGKFHAGLTVRWGQLEVATLSLELPPGMKTATKAVAMLDGKSVSANLSLSGGKVLVTFQPQILIPTSKALQITIS
jgi:non-lysosomal glucosylceramidase